VSTSSRGRNGGRSSGGCDLLLLILLEGDVDFGKSSLLGVFLLGGVSVLSGGFKLVGEGWGNKLLHLLVDGVGNFGVEGNGVWRCRSSVIRIGSVACLGGFGGIGRGRCAQGVSSKWWRSRRC